MGACVALRSPLHSVHPPNQSSRRQSRQSWGPHERIPQSNKRSTTIAHAHWGLATARTPRTRLFRASTMSTRQHSPGPIVAGRAVVYLERARIFRRFRFKRRWRFFFHLSRIYASRWVMSTADFVMLEKSMARIQNHPSIHEWAECMDHSECARIFNGVKSTYVEY